MCKGYYLRKAMSIILCIAVQDQPTTAQLLARMLSTASLLGELPPVATLFGFPDWTTSLWTLQEACLCSHMSLAASNFEYLQTETGVHFGLDAIICLLDFNLSSTFPPTVKQLRLCFSSLFGSSTPMKVMLMANERQCSGARAPAIMSVLGFTDWYTGNRATRLSREQQHRPGPWEVPSPIRRRSQV